MRSASDSENPNPPGSSSVGDGEAKDHEGQRSQLRFMEGGESDGDTDDERTGRDTM